MEYTRVSRIDVTCVSNTYLIPYEFYQRCLSVRKIIPFPIIIFYDFFREMPQFVLMVFFVRYTQLNNCPVTKCRQCVHWNSSIPKAKWRNIFVKDTSTAIHLLPDLADFTLISHRDLLHLVFHAGDGLQERAVVFLRASPRQLVEYIGKFVVQTNQILFLFCGGIIQSFDWIRGRSKARARSAARMAPSALSMGIKI